MNHNFNSSLENQDIKKIMYSMTMTICTTKHLYLPELREGGLSDSGVAAVMVTGGGGTKAGGGWRSSGDCCRTWPR